MRHVLVIFERGVRLLRVPGEPGIFEFLDVPHRADAERMLAAFRGNVDAMTQLRGALAFVANVPPLVAMSDDRVVFHLSELISNGRLRLARLERRRMAIIEAIEAPVTADAGKAVRKKLTWIEILVVNDLTGQPVPWVRMAVKVPSGEENFHTTDNEGLIRIEDIDPGTCDVRCDLKNATLADTLAFVAMGEKTDKPRFPADAFPSDNSIRRIAEIEEHKVRKGESIAGLAQKAGMKWQELAKFNWGTDVPDQINEALRDRVGCTKKTRDRLNYVFDDTDKPGIVYIPTKWEETGLATGKQHVVRAKPVNPFIVILQNELGLRIPEVEYKVTFADDSKKTGKLGLGGIDGIKDPFPGPIEVLYEDHTDILVKSLAMLARDAFERRDVQETFRILKHDPRTVQGMIDMYAKYCDDLSGKGFVEDAYAEVTDEEAVGRMETLMLLAGLEVRSGKTLLLAYPPDQSYDEHGITAPPATPPAHPSLPSLEGVSANG